ncbi:DNA-processing protein DprA [Patescibacteria group bacterium AH-259-L07]|nr:DNA-processing protein DprA [Patescibacteria group bacterium AH-259-L07]
MHTITIDDKHYPTLLKQINNPPEQLYVLGELQQKEQYPLAVVGTRKVSPYGRHVTEYFVKYLVQCGLTIISGLALGIDGLSHKTTLDTQGRTIAVLGSGLDTIFPAVHKKLAHDIVEAGGAVITEYPPEVPARRAYFPQRNRIISGMSLGVLVVEAPQKSGALITAAHALKQGRNVFAIPGRIYDTNSAGTNQLIQKGAEAVIHPNNILQRLGITTKIGGPTSDDSDISKEQALILKHLSNDPVHIDMLARACTIQTPELAALLTRLEIHDRVKDIGDGYYIKT